MNAENIIARAVRDYTNMRIQHPTLGAAVLAALEAEGMVVVHRDWLTEVQREGLPARKDKHHD